MRTNLSTAREDYLRAMYVLQEKAGKSVGVTEIAKYMHLSKPTVSERLKELAKDKLVIATHYGDAKLTLRGMREAEKITYKHRITEVFLHQVLKIPKGQVHVEAHKLEHAMSDKVIRRLANYLGRPKTDPHGSRIPNIRI